MATGEKLTLSKGWLQQEYEKRHPQKGFCPPKLREELREHKGDYPLSFEAEYIAGQ